MGDPVTIIVGAAIAVAVLSIVAYIVNRRRDAADSARRAAWLAAERQRTTMERGEVERLSRRIIATSSTSTIAGFVIERQIEAVFTDGHATPPAAVEALKAVAASKGANAVINIEGQRPGTGKCSARGDAVIVRAIERLSAARPGDGGAGGEVEGRPAGGPEDRRGQRP